MRTGRIQPKTSVKGLKAFRPARDLRFSKRGSDERLLTRGKLPNHDVENRCEDQAEKRDAEHAEEHSCAERLSHFCAGAAREHEGENAEYECKACHQDRTKPQPARLGYRFESVAALLFALLGEFDDEDGILASE